MKPKKASKRGSSLYVIVDADHHSLQFWSRLPKDPKGKGPDIEAKPIQSNLVFGRYIVKLPKNPSGFQLVLGSSLVSSARKALLSGRT